MKLLILVGGCFATVLSQMSPRGQKSDFCSESVKCNANECCLGDDNPKCRKLSMKGERCKYGYDERNTEKMYAKNCPCGEGLVCKQLGNEKWIKVCVEKNYCSEYVKCNANECCLGEDNPKCRKLSIEGERCNYGYDERNTEKKYAKYCPCGEGLVCKQLGKEKWLHICVEKDFCSEYIKCSANECCLGDDNLKCRKLSMKGERCNYGYDERNTEKKYAKNCPCGEGLVCKQLGKEKWIKVCVEKDFCSVSIKCSANECCLGDDNPKCRKLSMKGERCNYGYEERNAEKKYAKYCPCGEGLVCKQVGNEKWIKACVEEDQ